MDTPRFHLEYTERALDDLDSIPSADADRILRKVSRLELGLHGDIKHLQNSDYNYRLRMGNFRVLFDVVKDRIIVQRIKNRRDAYE